MVEVGGQKRLRTKGKSLLSKSSFAALRILTINKWVFDKQ